MGKLLVVEHFEEGKSLVLKSPVASLSIKPHPTVHNVWMVTWRIIHMHDNPPLIGQDDDGTRMLTTDELKAAFGFSDTLNHPVADRSVVVMPDVTVGMWGKFARKDDYLNIPDMGTGRPGSPCLSVLLTAAIRSKVSALMRP